MVDDKVSRSKTGRGPTRLKNMFKKINKDDKIQLCIDVHTGVATGLLKMVAAPSRHVFDEDLYVLFLCILLCFKCVLGSA